MDEIKEIEESANSFLKNFFDTTYNDNKVLFNNMQSIYLLIIFLYYNMQELNIEKQDIQNGTRKDYVEKSKIIDNFYKSINVDFKMEYITRNGILNILSTNTPKEATHSQIYTGSNNYVITEEAYINPQKKERIVLYRKLDKTINVHNNDLLNDSIIWVHEISHYKNQPPEKRGEVNIILTELIAYTEELIYTDYLSQIGYEEEARMFMIEEYKSLYNLIGLAYHVIKITFLYYLLGEVSKESYKLLYKDEEEYEDPLKIFDEEKNKNQNIIFLMLHYSVAIISFYNYIEYKKDSNYLNKLKKLNKEIMTNISLEDALKIIDIKLNKKSLNKILENINIFKDSLIKKTKKKRILN